MFFENIFLYNIEKAGPGFDDTDEILLQTGEGKWKRRNT